MFTLHYSYFRTKLCRGIAVGVVLTTGCGPMGSMAGLAENELRRELAECAAIASPSNAKAIACQNFQRECERRVKDDGMQRNC